MSLTPPFKHDDEGEVAQQLCGEWDHHLLVPSSLPFPSFDQAAPATPRSVSPSFALYASQLSPLPVLELAVSPLPLRLPLPVSHLSPQPFPQLSSISSSSSSCPVAQLPSPPPLDCVAPTESLLTASTTPLPFPVSPASLPSTAATATAKPSRRSSHVQSAAEPGPKKENRDRHRDFDRHRRAKERRAVHRLERLIALCTEAEEDGHNGEQGLEDDSSEEEDGARPARGRKSRKLTVLHASAAKIRRLQAAVVRLQNERSDCNGKCCAWSGFFQQTSIGFALIELGSGRLLDVNESFVNESSWNRDDLPYRLVSYPWRHHDGHSLDDSSPTPYLRAKQYDSSVLLLNDVVHGRRDSVSVPWRGRLRRGGMCEMKLYCYVLDRQEKVKQDGSTAVVPARAVAAFDWQTVVRVDPAEICITSPVR